MQDVESTVEQKRIGGTGEMSIDKPCFQPSQPGVTSPPLMPQANPGAFNQNSSLGTMFEM